jgi:hypothetical protein
MCFFVEVGGNTYSSTWNRKPGVGKLETVSIGGKIMDLSGMGWLYVGRRELR